MTLTILSGWACAKTVWTPLLDALGDLAPQTEFILCTESAAAAENRADHARDGRPAQSPRVALAHSLGALDALAATIENPARFDALILLAATARLPADAGYPGADPRACKAMRARLLRDPAGLLRDFAALACAPGPAQPNLFISPAPEHLRSLADGLARLQNTDLRQACRGAALPPTLLIHGAQDAVIPVASAATLAEALADAARLCVIPNAGHMLPATHPQPVAALIRAFLRKPGHAS